MRMMFWNVRGLGKAHRRALIKNHILQENLDIVAIQETIKQDFQDWELKKMSGNRELNFGNCFAWSKPRVGSDHSPLILDTGENNMTKSKYFYFEDNWFQHGEFVQIVGDKWSRSPDLCQKQYSLDKWHYCLQSLRQFLRGWSLRKKGEVKEERRSISHRIEEIDLISEKKLLSLEEWEERLALEGKMEELEKWDLIKWKQRAGKNWLLHGDANSHFFHQFVNGRRRKNTIRYLESDCGEIRGQREITEHIMDFYKKLFGPSNACSLLLKDDFWPESYRVSEADKVELSKPFTLEEIKAVIMDMKENSAPGPIGFGVSFLRNSGTVLKKI